MPADKNTSHEIALLGLIIEELPKLPLDAQVRVADYVDRLVVDGAAKINRAVPEVARRLKAV